MSEHPIRLIAGDDLRRSRLTVLLRPLLATMHLAWLGLWSVAAAPAALVAGPLALVTGRVPGRLHRFLADYVRATLHVGAYVTFAANPYPGFLGLPGSYPVDLEIPPAARQSRWSIALRLPFALPAIALGCALAGCALLLVPGVLGTVVVLAWPASLIRGRMPAGLRNLALYALRYLAQLSAYLLLLTDRYPEGDPRRAGATAPAPHPVALAMDDGDRARSRLNVLFLLPLAWPHILWMQLWSLLVTLVVPIAWLLALACGRVPARLHRFLAAYARYGVHLEAFLSLVGGRFPGFTGRAGAYPVDLEIAGPAPQRRLVTLARLPLAIPAAVLAAALLWLLALVAVLGWFAALVLGRMPEGLRRLGGYVVGYRAQLSAYAVLLLTDRYPDSDPGGVAPPLAVVAP